MGKLNWTSLTLFQRLNNPENNVGVVHDAPAVPDQVHELQHQSWPQNVLGVHHSFKGPR